MPQSANMVLGSWFDDSDEDRGIWWPKPFVDLPFHYPMKSGYRHHHHHGHHHGHHHHAIIEVDDSRGPAWELLPPRHHHHHVHMKPHQHFQHAHSYELAGYMPPSPAPMPPSPAPMPPSPAPQPPPRACYLKTRTRCDTPIPASISNYDFYYKCPSK